MRRSPRVEGERDAGFTLIELLVVIIIVGILAGIAIPVFLNQRKKALESSMKSDLRQAAHFMETYYVDTSTYPTSAADFPSDLSFGEGTVITVESDGAAPGTYCLKATNPMARDSISYDSDRGGILLPGTACS
jgi:type IV pilus assembly protein PilA